MKSNIKEKLKRFSEYHQMRAHIQNEWPLEGKLEDMLKLRAPNSTSSPLKHQVARTKKNEWRCRSNTTERTICSPDVILKAGSITRHHPYLKIMSTKKKKNIIVK